MKAIELSTNSMILYDDLERPTALIIEHSNNKVDMYTDTATISYKNMEELQLKHGVFEVMKRPEQTTTEVEGYPVDFEEVFNIEVNDGVASFTKNEKSSIRYAAGYFGIMFSDQYVPAHCPKLSTLEKYNTIGPFKEVITLRSELLNANRSIVSS